MADIELGPEGGQALANFLQGNNTLRSLHLVRMPREEGERRDVWGLLCVWVPFLFLLLEGGLWLLLRERGEGRKCEAAGRCGGVGRGAKEQAKGQGGG